MALRTHASVRPAIEGSKIVARPKRTEPPNLAGKRLTAALSIRPGYFGLFAMMLSPENLRCGAIALEDGIIIRWTTRFSEPDLTRISRTGYPFWRPLQAPMHTVSNVTPTRRT
jgi:hypothetical protein